MSSWKRDSSIMVAVLALALSTFGCGQKSLDSTEDASTPAKNPDRTKSRAEETSRPTVVHAGMGGGILPAAASAASDSSQMMEDLLLTPESYYYESVGRRDLFESLVSDDYRDANPTQKPASAELTVVGILWGERDRFALVETAQGRSRVLREGDRLGDGTVVRVLPDRVIIHVTEYGGSRTVTLPLVEGGGFDESPNARRR